MDVYKRGIKNAFRNPIRTVAIVIILGLSMGVGLSMLIARGAVQDKIASIKSSIGNTISISPAGARGFEGGGEPLTTDQLAPIKSLSSVTSITQVLRDRLTAENTSLVSAIDAGSLGRRASGNNGVQFNGRQGNRTFTPPVTVIGADTATDATLFGADKVAITSGTLIDPTTNNDQAMVGKTLATKNSLAIGSTFTVYEKPITVVAIYDAGNDFANNSVFMPLASLQRLSSQDKQVTSATITTSSIDTLDSVVAKTKETLGAAADVVSNQENAKTTLQPLESVKTISSYSLIGALVAAAIIILLSMVMIVRERRREIGVMKAIGSTNSKTVLQFVTESVTLTLLGMIVAVGLGIAASGPITKTLVNNSSATPNTVTVSGNAQRAFRVGGPTGGLNVALRGAKSVTPHAGPEVLLYAVLAALFVAILGSAIPAFMISKVRPSEVMRAD
jgi:putative ABC transport system permease protein